MKGVFSQVALSEARKRANKKYQDKHKSEVAINVKRSQAKSYIREYVREDELNEFKKLISDREADLKNKS